MTDDDAAQDRLSAMAPKLLKELEFAVSILKTLFSRTEQVKRMEVVIRQAKGEEEWTEETLK